MTVLKRLASALPLVFSLFVVLSPVISSAATPNVYYGGFAFTGKAADIDKSFRFSRELNRAENGVPGPLEVAFRDFFKQHAQEITGFNLKFAKADQTNANSETLVMALAVTREDFYSECVSDCSKIALNLFLQVVFIDMPSKTIVNSYPLHLEIINTYPQKPGDSQKLLLLKTAYFGSEEGQSSILSILKGDLPTYKVASANIKNIQVRKVTIESKAAQALFPDANQTLADAYADSVSQRFSDELARNAKVSVLPSGRDALNGKCSLVFADGSQQDFKIPEASYAIDLTLHDLQTKDLNANNIEVAKAFGAFLNVRVYEPEYQTEFFQKKVIHGAPKKFAVTTKEYDLQSIYKEVVQITLKKAVTEMLKDSKLKKGVIDKCVIL